MLLKNDGKQYFISDTDIEYDGESRIIVDMDKAREVCPDLGKVCYQIPCVKCMQMGQLCPVVMEARP